MYKIINVADFGDNSYLENLSEKYSREYNIDYFELIKFANSDNTSLKDKIKGYHLRFFPTWLDWYFFNENEIKDKSLSEEYLKSFYGGTSKAEMLDYYRNELEIAKKLGAEYVVLHGGSVSIEESFDYNFRFSDKEILEKIVEFVNDIFDDEKYHFKLLLENLWWSGLKLTSYDEVDYLIKSIKYKNIGFMLDTGHMMNTNLELKDLDEGVDYILQNIKNLKEYKNYILGIHLNSSLSGRYTKSKIEEYRNKKLSLKEMLKIVYPHVNKIDPHNPFETERVKDILKELSIKYLVFELIGYTQEEVENKIQRQLNFL